MTSNDMQLLMTIPFAGFYYSIWDQAMEREIEDEANDLIQHDGRFVGADIEDVEQAVREQVDWNEARTTIARHYADAFGKCVRRRLGMTDEDFRWEFESLRSPREYNFRTDRIFVKASCQVVRGMGHQTDAGILERLVKDRFTTRSGFISHYSNKLNEWLFKPSLTWDHNQLGTLLLAWLDTRGVDAEALERDIKEGMEQQGVIADAIPLDDDAVYARLAESAAQS